MNETEVREREDPEHRDAGQRFVDEQNERADETPPPEPPAPPSEPPPSEPPPA
jgi:hypothetical protein